MKSTKMAELKKNTILNIIKAHNFAISKFLLKMQKLNLNLLNSI